MYGIIRHYYSYIIIVCTCAIVRSVDNDYVAIVIIV